MNIQETEAIVLSTSDYGESDRLITFYTRKGGKVKGIAKGARRSRKRFANVFEPGSLVELTYKERRTLVWIEACKLLEPYLELRMEIERWGYAALVSEVMMEMVPEGEPQEELFFLLKETLDRLSEEKDPLNVVLLFFIRFLDLNGYLPALDKCHVCKRSLKEELRWCWRMDEGVLLCREHCSVQRYDLRLDAGTLVLISQVRMLPLDRIWRLHIRQDKKHSLLQALTAWARGHIRKELKSLKLLEQVQSA